MKRLRYYTETLLRPDNLHDHSVHRSKMSEFSKDYHWVRVDDNTILGYANLHEDNFHKLQNHEHLVLHPSLHDKTPTKNHLIKKGKLEHYDSLVNHHGAQDHHTILDIIGNMVENGHTFLSPEK